MLPDVSCFMSQVQQFKKGAVFCFHQFQIIVIVSFISGLEHYNGLESVKPPVSQVD